LHLGDARADDTTVRLELALTRTARPDAALRAGEVRPQARQPWQLVFELRELDLEASFVGLRVEREDIEDQPAAVDDLDAQELFERPLLRRRELVVSDEDVEARLASGRRQFLGFALADVPVRVHVAAVLPL